MLRDVIDSRRTATAVALALTVVVAAGVPPLLYAVTARAVEGPAPDLWFLVLVPLVPGLVAVLTSRARGATTAAVLSVVALTIFVGFYAASAGDSHASQEAHARQYDDACNTAYSGLSVPLRVDAAFRDIGRVEAHHLHGPAAGSFHGCTMNVSGDVDDAFAAWRAHLVESGWRVVRDDSEVVVARRGVRLTLYVSGGEVFLNAAELGADDCAAGRVRVNTTRTTDPDVEVASLPC